MPSYSTPIISTLLAAVLRVLLAPANFIVDVSNLLPVASCVIKIVALVPATAFVNALNVKLAFAVYLNIVPTDASGEILVLVFADAGSVSLYLVNTILPDVVVPVTLNELNVPTLVIFGCAAVVTLPLKFGAANTPVVLLIVKVELAPVLPASLN